MLSWCDSYIVHLYQDNCQQLPRELSTDLRTLEECDLSTGWVHSHYNTTSCDLQMQQSDQWNHLLVSNRGRRGRHWRDCLRRCHCVFQLTWPLLPSGTQCVNFHVNMSYGTLQIHPSMSTIVLPLKKRRFFVFFNKALGAPNRYNVFHYSERSLIHSQVITMRKKDHNDLKSKTK